MPSTAPSARRVALVTLGCARNEVDSEELAGRLAADGWTLVEDAGDADVAVVNTCGFVEAAKKDSIDTVLQAADLKGNGRTQAVVAVGCLAERYGEQLAASLPEADAVLGFDDYADISARLGRILAGEAHVPHVPSDRRHLLPLAPVDRQAEGRAVPGHGAVERPDLPDGVAPASGPRSLRMRLGSGPVAPLKLASGCDRRCTFCAIPSFRGSFVSRRPGDVLTEARWLVEKGVREVVLVSENSTSYGKDLGDLRLLETLLPEIAAIDGIDRVRVSYLQPAEMRPSLVEVMTTTEGVAPYFDLSFQHASGPVLRRMRRFGDADRFIELVGQIRAAAPDAGVRSNVIVGFPGETDADLAELERFLVAARLDAVGVFGYSDEDGTEAAALDGKHPVAVIRERTERVSALADELVSQRAEDRLGETVHVLVESVSGPVGEGRAAHQAPEVDGTTTVHGAGLEVGRIVAAKVVATDGVDLVAEVLGVIPKPSNWNIANALTVLRLVLVPVFLIQLLHEDGENNAWRVAAFVTFAVASVTDRIDGELARKHGLVTDFGQIADPIADKALIGAALVGLSLLDELWWWVTVLILVREIGVTLLRFFVIRHGVMPASRGGKVKTLLQGLAIGLYVLPLPSGLHWVAVGLMVAAVVLTVITGVDYVARAVHLRRTSPRAALKRARRV